MQESLRYTQEVIQRNSENPYRVMSLKNAFYYEGAVVWNSLPKSLQKKFQLY